MTMNEHELREEMITSVINFLKETNNHLISIQFSSTDILYTKIFIKYYKIINNDRKVYTFTYDYNIEYPYDCEYVLYEFNEYLKRIGNVSVM